MQPRLPALRRGALRRQRRAQHHIAVVGGGPSGFYLAKAVLTKLPDARVDVFDRLPVPFGLARYGVAPDHPEVKAVARTFERLFEGDEGRQADHVRRVHFFGNTPVGGGGRVSVAQLLSSYHQVVLATGAAADHRIGIPGEERCLPARALVEWYNGARSAPPTDLSGVRSVAIIGNGNVAMDCARVLIAPPSLLHPTDITSPAAAAIAAAGVRTVSLVARRGLLNAAFTIKEFREMAALGEADAKKPWYTPDPDTAPWCSVETHDGSLGGVELADLPRPRQRLTKLVLDTQPRAGAARTFRLRFLRRPVEITAGGVVCEVMRDEGGGRVSGTGETETIPADLVMKSVGYRGTPLVVDGAGADPDAPFDAERGVVPSTPEGRVLRDGGVAPRLYAVGWAKNGARGVILEALSDANRVGASVVDDATRGDLFAGCGGQGVGGLGDAVAGATSWEDWRLLEAAERAAGEAAGKVAEKVVGQAEMLDAIAAARRA